MTEEYLQVAFEIKATCDEISRRLLRWHWEQRPGARSLDALLEYVVQRRQESPSYYDRLPDLSDKTSWQQLDTTICMRILLDPEDDAANPVDLLGNTAYPAAARRACNAVRTARNEAAHASDRSAAEQAAILFSEAVESLEEGYANSALQENELARYYRRAEDFIARLSGEDTANDEADDLEQAQSAASGSAAAKRSRKTEKGATASQKQKTRSSAGSAAVAPHAKNTGTAGRNGSGRPKKQQGKGEDRALAVILLAAVLVGLALRARSMGLI